MKVVQDILGPDGSIARRLGKGYEHRPQQMELASAVGAAVQAGEHLVAEAGTGVGKSFAYLVPVIEWAVRNKKRVVVSTHTIALQEQLIEKDIPLIRAVYPDEFSAVLVKGRSNYLCQRRLLQARGRQGYLFETDDELKSLWAIEQWAAEQVAVGGLGTLSEFKTVPLPQVWDKVAAEHGNCLGKKCEFYKGCFWQAARTRMQTGNVLVVNHALFFSDLALRMAGVNYLPKYDVVVLDEAHTVEEVAGQHFGIKVSEASVKYNLRTLYDLRRGRGVLSTFGGMANDAISCVLDLNELAEEFFARAIHWQENSGRSNGRIREPGIVDNTLSPKLKELATRLRGLVTHTQKDEEIAELTALAGKVELMGGALDALVQQQMPDAVYWLEVGGNVQGRAVKRATWHAAPVDVAEGLRRQLFGKMHSVVMTSATLCTEGGRSGRGNRSWAKGDSTSTACVTGVPPVSGRGAAGGSTGQAVRTRGYLPHLTPKGAVFAICFRLADSIAKEVAEAWSLERRAIENRAKEQKRPLTSEEDDLLAFFNGERVEAWLDKGEGECLLRRPEVAEIVQVALQHFDGDRYDLVAWSIMPNHVHAIVRPLEGSEVPAILHTWKSFTAHAINEKLGREGSVWMEESYDRMIRNEDELEAQVVYAAKNPERAGLAGWEWFGRNDEAFEMARGFVGKRDDSPPGGEHGRDARDTGGAGPSNDSRTTPQEPKPGGAWKVPGEYTPPPPEFSYLANRVGLRERARFLQVGSPFEYERQCTLYVEGGLPDPSDRMFAGRAREKVMKYLRQTRGGAFVLFTAYKPMIEMANALKAEIEGMGCALWVQGQGAPRKVLLERFKGTPNSVLFGTASFWQGIDVQGEALRNVIIVKLPFSVPDEPLVEAKLEAITKAGGNAFMEYSVPEAIIKLKQGFGRLIRSRTDEGIVVILDSRVVTKRYGRMFLDSLPKCKVIEVGRDAEDEFQGYGDEGGSQVWE